MVCRTIEMRPSLWTVFFNIMQEWGTSSQWRQNDPTHASVDDVIAEIITMTDRAVMAGCTMLGEIKELAIGTIPDWLLLCDGATYNRVDYPDLYAILDSAFILDADTFRVPDRIRRFGVGGVAMGTQEGSETHTNTIGELVPHHHQYNEVFATLVDPGVAPSVIGIDDINASDTTDTGDGDAFSILNPVEGSAFYIVAKYP